MSTTTTEPKYKNYAELSAAFKSGELNKDFYAIRLDKGGMDASLNYYNPEFTDEANEREQEKCDALFNPEYADHIEDLYAALSIPVGWV